MNYLSKMVIFAMLVITRGFGVPDVSRIPWAPRSLFLSFCWETLWSLETEAAKQPDRPDLPLHRHVGDCY